MARKDRSLAGFNEVANSEQNDSVNQNVNVNNNENVSANENENIDPLDRIINENKKKDKTHILKGIYFEREVAAAIDRLSKTGGKGIKSQIVNEAVKKAFKEKGWL